MKLIHGLVRRFAATRPGAWLGSRVLHRLDRVFLRSTGGRRTLSASLSGLPVMILTTTGARSGVPRTLPLVYLRDERCPDQLALVASNWGNRRSPAWYYNLKANPRATGSIEGQTCAYLAREADGEEYERYWQLASEVYIGFPRYKQRAGERRIPIMVLTAVMD